MSAPTTRDVEISAEVLDFVRRGGSLLAVYWGPLVRGGVETPPPCYALQEMLGAHPTGWRGTEGSSGLRWPFPRPFAGWAPLALSGSAACVSASPFRNRGE